MRLRLRSDRQTRFARSALVVASIMGGTTLMVAAPASAAEPHYNLTTSFIAYTDSATPDTTTFYPSGGILPLGMVQDETVSHASRAYLGFDIAGVQRVRLQDAQLVVDEYTVNDCSKHRSVVAQATAPFEATNTWANPPAILGTATPAVAADANCPTRLTFDLTNALDNALGRADNRLWIEIRVPQNDEGNLAFGRRLAGNDIRFRITLTNTTPATPTKLAAAGFEGPCPSEYFASSDFTVEADQTDADRSPWDMLTSEIEYWPTTDPSAVVPLRTGQGSGWEGGFGFATIPVSTMPDGTYAWHARTFDTRAYSGWSTPCQFSVDQTAPALAPTVSSPEYPENPSAPTGLINHPGAFLFTSNGVSDVKEFFYGTSEYNMWNRVPADQLGGAAIIEWNPRDAGDQSLFVVSSDRAGNRSPVREYRFKVRTYGLSGFSKAQVADPSGALGMAVTLHFATQVGNGITTVAYSIDGGAERTATIGENGTVDTVVTPVRAGTHTLAYAGRDATGATLAQTLSTTFYVTDAPKVTSDGVYPIGGSGGGVGVPGVFTVSPTIGVGVQDVQYFTNVDSTTVTVPVDADGKARITWAPTKAGFHYFWFKVRYTDGTSSWSTSFSVTVSG